MTAITIIVTTTIIRIFFITFCTGPKVFLNKSKFNSSKRARVKVSEKSVPSIKPSISKRAWCCADKVPIGMYVMGILVRLG